MNPASLRAFGGIPRRSLLRLALRLGVGRAFGLVPLSLLAAILLGCGGEPGGPPSVLLVTIDTLRADRIGAYGHAAAETPTIDRLARGGVLFERAIAPAPITLPSHASILTGVYPFAHGAVGNGLYRLKPETVSIAEVLNDAGWRTAASVGAYVLDARFGLDQGFDVYRSPTTSAAGSYAAFPADKVVDGALGWLQWLERDERFFLWTHFFDPHHDYAAPASFAKRFEDPYDAEVAFVDAQLGRLLAGIEALGFAQNLLVIVTSDHGESLGEHGESTHGWLIYQSTQHVPLVFWGRPVAASAGTRVARTVSSVDIAASLLALVGLGAGAMPDLQTPSLFESDGRVAAARNRRAVVIESHMPNYAMGWRAERGLVWGDESFIDGSEPELYDLATDPGEVHDLARDRPERVAEMRAQLASLLERPPRLGWSAPLQMDADTSARLEALGYLSPAPSGRDGTDPFDPVLPEARDHIGEAVAMREAHEKFLQSQALDRTLARDGSAFRRAELERERRALLESAQDLLKPIVAANPDGAVAADFLAGVEIALGNAEEAARLLEGVLSIEPGRSSAHYNLGVAYRALGRHADATAAFERAVELEPEQRVYARVLAQHLAETAGADAEPPESATAR